MITKSKTGSFRFVDVKSLLSFRCKSLALYEDALSNSLHALVRLASIKPIVKVSTRQVNVIYYGTLSLMVCCLLLASMLGFYSVSPTTAMLTGVAMYAFSSIVARLYARSTLNTFMSDAIVYSGISADYMYARYPFGVVSCKKLESICLKYSCDMAAKVLLIPAVFRILENSKLYSEETLNMSLNLCPDFELSLAELLDAGRCLQ